MWLNVFMDDCHFTNIVKINKTFIPNYIKENKNLQFFKKMDIFYIMKIIFLKFRIHIEFTKSHKSI